MPPNDRQPSKTILADRSTCSQIRRTNCYSAAALYVSTSTSISNKTKRQLSQQQRTEYRTGPVPLILRPLARSYKMPCIKKVRLRRPDTLWAIQLREVIRLFLLSLDRSGLQTVPRLNLEIGDEPLLSAAATTFRRYVCGVLDVSS